MDPRRDLLARAVGLVVLAAGAALALIRFVNSEAPEQRDLEATIGTLAFGFAVAVPGVLTLMARHGRPTLLLPAALLLVPFSFLSFALVTLPLLIPAGMLLAAYSTNRIPGRGVLDASIAATLTVSCLASVVVLFALQSERTYSTPTMTLSTSIISYPGVGMSLGLTTVSLLFGWFASAPVAIADHSDR